MQPKKEGPRVNKDIRAENVRLIDAKGQMIGVVSITDALTQAEEAGLDLVEISPQVDPPVCKVLDYGKYKYEAQKRSSAAKKKQKVIEVKEIKLRPTIEANDYLVKVRRMRKFFEDGNKVKVTLRFRGREMSHQEIGLNLLKKIQEEVSDIAKAELAPKQEGRQMIMILVPDKVS